MNQQIIDFYMGTGADDQGRYLEDILLWSSDELEHVHDYIQWLFPLNEPSQFNKNAPLFDEETVEAFADNRTCTANLVRATERMLDFYELRKNKEGLRVVPGKVTCHYKTLHPRKPWWVNKGDHNYLRFTRILKCLNLVGLSVYAEMIYQLLRQLYEIYTSDIGDTTIEFWYSAAFHDDVDEINFNLNSDNWMLHPTRNYE